MGRSGKSKAARDQRKQKKAQRRKARKDRRAPSEGALPPWNPVEDGVRGWAWRNGADFWTAARLLSARTDLPAEFWTEDRVATLTTEVLVHHLARLGAPTDREAFRVLGDTYGSVNDLVHEVWPDAQPSQALDYDLLRLATRELYRRWVDRWPCLEDIADRWGDGLVDETTAASVLTRAGRTADELTVHLAAPDASLNDMIVNTAGLMGWFVTVLDEAEAASLEDPETARLALPVLEMLAACFDGDAEDRLGVLRALAMVWIANDQRAHATERLRAWSRARESCEGVVALAEAWGADEPECPPERRQEALRMLCEAQDKGWFGVEVLDVAARIEDVRRVVEG